MGFLVTRKNTTVAMETHGPPSPPPRLDALKLPTARQEPWLHEEATYFL